MPTLEREFNVPIFGVILPGVRAALERTHDKRIGVIGTSATVRSGAYSKGILARCDTARVFTRACPLLVPLVEEGWRKHPITLAVLRQYLRPLLRHRIDTLVLGCTHYPLLRTAIRQVAGRDMALVDSAESCARFVRERLWESESSTLLRRFRLGRAEISAYAEDYAYLVFGLLELFQADPDPSWLNWAVMAVLSGTLVAP